MSEDEAAGPDLEDGARLQRDGRFAEAVAVYRQVAQRYVSVHLAANLGACLAELGEFEEAARWQALAVQHRPQVVLLRLGLGQTLGALGRAAEAEAQFRAALALEPDNPLPQLQLAGLLLTEGRYAEGWPLMEARTAIHERNVPALNLPYPEWTGGPLDGKAVLVGVEQGLGDQIQMCRFAATLKARGASRVTMACRPPLAPLFLSNPAIDETIPLAAGQGASVGPHDLWTRYFSLPHRLGITLETLPAEPYLFADPALADRWRPKARVGLAWLANASGFNVAAKNLPAEQAQRLFDLGLISLQPEDTGVTDMAQTAAIIAGLDLVVAIDTAVAHLAGAMGKPCWTLIPRLRTDWRWLRGRTDSPWYPSMRLYRQQAAFDWAPEVDAVIADLRAGGFVG